MSQQETLRREDLVMCYGNMKMDKRYSLLKI